MMEIPDILQFSGRALHSARARERGGELGETRGCQHSAQKRCVSRMARLGIRVEVSKSHGAQEVSLAWLGLTLPLRCWGLL